MTACYPISFQIMSPNVFKEVCLKEWQRIYKGLKGKYVFSKNRENIWKLLNAKSCQASHLLSTKPHIVVA